MSSPCSVTTTGTLQPPLDFGNAAGSENVAEDDHVGLELAREPLRQPLDFLPLKALGAAENRERQIGHLLRDRSSRFARTPN